MQENNVMMLEEVWRNQEGLEYHLRFEEYRNLLLLMEIALKEPEISFNTIVNTAGIEAIEKARRQTR